MYVGVLNPTFGRKQQLACGSVMCPASRAQHVLDTHQLACQVFWIHPFPMATLVGSFPTSRLGMDLRLLNK